MNASTINHQPSAINKLLLILTMFFVFCAPAFAQKRAENNVNLGLEIANYEYKEPGVMKLYGTMVGLYFQYVVDGGVDKPVGGQFRTRFNYMYGSDLTYDGGYISNGRHYPLERDDETVWYFDWVLAGGPRFGKGVFSVAPYVGFGIRYHVDENEGPVVSDYGHRVGEYERRQLYLYSPLGADWKFSLPQGWKVIVNTELDYLWYGYHESDMSDFGEGTLQFVQDEGYGLRLSAKVEKKWGGAGFFVEPYYKYWNIDDSDTDCSWRACYYEPKNNTREVGLRFGAKF